MENVIDNSIGPGTRYTRTVGTPPVLKDTDTVVDGGSCGDVEELDICEYEI